MKPKSIVSQKAVVQRINRKLWPEGVLRMSRSVIMRKQIGRYYILDVRRESIARRDVDIESLGRELKALQPWETIARDPIY